MPDGVARTYRIVVAVDGSDYADSVALRGLDLAGRLGPSDLHFLRVVDGGRRLLRGREGRVEGEVDEAHRELGELVHGALVDYGPGDDAERSSWSVRLHAIAGDPAEEILELAADVQADFIVIGRWGEEKPRRHRLGLVPGAVVAEASCPVLVDQPTDYGMHVRAEDACEDCVELRRTTHGERWFCAVHDDARGFRTTIVELSSFLGGASQF